MGPRGVGTLRVTVPPLLNAKNPIVVNLTSMCGGDDSALSASGSLGEEVLVSPGIAWRFPRISLIYTSEDSKRTFKGTVSADEPTDESMHGSLLFGGSTSFSFAGVSVESTVTSKLTLHYRDMFGSYLDAKGELVLGTCSRPGGSSKQVLASMMGSMRLIDTANNVFAAEGAEVEVMCSKYHHGASSTATSTESSSGVKSGGGVAAAEQCVTIRFDSSNPNAGSDPESNIQWDAAPGVSLTAPLTIRATAIKGGAASGTGAGFTAAFFGVVTGAVRFNETVGAAAYTVAVPDSVTSGVHITAVAGFDRPHCRIRTFSNANTNADAKADALAKSCGTHLTDGGINITAAVNISVDGGFKLTTTLEHRYPCAPGSSISAIGNVSFTAGGYTVDDVPVELFWICGGGSSIIFVALILCVCSPFD